MFLKKISLFLVSALLMISSTYGQEEPSADTFKPSGKPFVKIFTNFHTDIVDGNTFSQFELTRAYLGYSYNFSKNFSAKANLDFGDTGSQSYFLIGFLKNAYVKYETKGLSIQFGLIGTTMFGLQENFWGGRYLYKSFQDAYRMGPSADLGISAAYQFNKYISADLAVFNGEGYKRLENDSTLKYAAGVTVRPVDGLTVRAYYDYMNKDAAQQSFSFFTGYQAKKWSLGGEYNHQLNQGMNEGRDYGGISVYGDYSFKKIRVFGRFDQLNSVKIGDATDPWNLSRDGQLVIAGLEYSPIKGIKISPNYQLYMPRESGAPSVNGAYLSLEIKY